MGSNVVLAADNAEEPAKSRGGEVGKKLKYETGGRSYQMLPCSTVSPRCLHRDPSNSFLEDSPIWRKTRPRGRANGKNR